MTHLIPKLKCILLAVFVLGSGIAFGQSPIVWPGDVNNDGFCNQYDFLGLGVHFGTTDSARTNQGGSWAAVSAPTWADSLANGTNLSAVDCNGDGVINFGDYAVIDTNWSLTHDTSQLQANRYTILSAQSSDPPLFLSSAQFDTVFAGDSVSISLRLGDTSVVNNFYGIAFDVEFERNLIDTGTMVQSVNGWTGATLGFYREAQNEGVMSSAIVRNDQQASSGSGLIATISFVMEQNVAGKINAGVDTLNLRITNIVAVGPQESQFAVRESTFSILVIDTTSSLPPAPGGNLLVYPNPANQYVDISWGKAGYEDLVVFDLSGRLVYQAAVRNASSHNISTRDWVSGQYVVHATARKHTESRRFAIYR